ncbi:MAG: hypothetical protein ACLP7I_01100, partial [Limisphaerales bacterium]
VVLAGEPFGWRRFAAAALLGFVASFSFANGVLFWPVGLFLLLAVPIGGRQRIAAIAGWLLISALTVGAYFHHYRSPEGHPPWDCLFHQPLTYVAYLLKYFGNFFGQHAVGDIPTHGDIALAAGLVGIVALGWAAGVLLRGKIADFRTLLPYFAMSLYSVITALVTGVGRLGFGSDEATFSRYCTMMVPFWASLVIFLFLLAQVPPRGRRRVHRRRWFRAGATRLKPVVVARQMVGRWSLRAALAFLLLGSFCAMDGAKEWSYEQFLSRDYLLSLAANPGKQIDYRGMSQTLYPWPVVILERYPILIQHRLSLFRNWKAPATSQ